MAEFYGVFTISLKYILLESCSLLFLLFVQDRKALFVQDYAFKRNVYIFLNYSIRFYSLFEFKFRVWTILINFVRNLKLLHAKGKQPLLEALLPLDMLFTLLGWPNSENYWVPYVRIYIAKVFKTISCSNMEIWWIFNWKNIFFFQLKIASKIRNSNEIFKLKFPRIMHRI